MAGPVARPQRRSSPREPGPAWAFLPALGAALAHAPVLRFDLLPRLKRPLDGGSGVFGQNKTWRGALMMSSGTVAATAGLTRLEWFRAKLPQELHEASPVAYGGLLGAAVVLGELPNSFFKRRLGVAPGASGGVAMSVLDQADFVLGAWLLLAPLWRMRPRQVAEAFAVVAAVHSGVNVVGYAVGARTSPI
jgi:CDP-archaeol synthase